MTKEKKMTIFALQVYVSGTAILTYQTLYKDLNQAQQARAALQPVFEGHYIKIEPYTINE